MAEITFFHYIHKDTILHRMDGRLKLLCLLLLSLSASFASQLEHYLVLLFVVIFALLIAKLPIKASVSYTHLDVYKRQPLDNPEHHLTRCMGRFQTAFCPECGPFDTG